MILVFAAIIGVVVSLAAWGFLELVHGIQVGVYEDLPGDIGFDTAPWWWPLPWLAIAGLLMPSPSRDCPARAVTFRPTA